MQVRCSGEFRASSQSEREPATAPTRRCGRGLRAVDATVRRATVLAYLCAVFGGLACTAVSAGAAISPPHRLHQASTGTIGIRLLEAPVNRRDDPRARVYIVDYLAPGAVIHRRLEVVNTSSRQQHVELYAAAASITGDRFVGAADRTANDLSDWVSLDSRSRDIPGGGHADLEATITVPASAPSGERYAVIWAQVSSPPGSSGTVRVVNRVGVRLYLDVGIGGEPGSDFAILSLAAARTHDGTPEVLAQVHNTGARALDMTGSLKLTDGPGSMSAGPFPADLGLTLGVGNYGQIIVPLDRRLPDGPWTAQLALASGQVQHTVQARLTFPEKPGVAAPVTPQLITSDRDLIPLLILGSILGALLLLSVGALVWWLWRRRRRRREAPPPQQPRTPQPAAHDPAGGAE